MEKASLLSQLKTHYLALSFLTVLLFTPLFSSANQRCDIAVLTRTEHSASGEELSNLQVQFPNLYVKIQNAENIISNIKHYEKPYSRNLTFGEAYRTRKTEFTEQDFNNQYAQYRPLAMEIYKALRNEKKFAAYYRDLLVQAALVTARSKKNDAMKLLEEGKIP